MFFNLESSIFKLVKYTEKHSNVLKRGSLDPHTKVLVARLVKSIKDLYMWVCVEKEPEEKIQAYVPPVNNPKKWSNIMLCNVIPEDSEFSYELFANSTQDVWDFVSVVQQGFCTKKKNTAHYNEMDTTNSKLNFPHVLDIPGNKWTKRLLVIFYNAIQNLCERLDALILEDDTSGQTIYTTATRKFIPEEEDQDVTVEFLSRKNFFLGNYFVDCTDIVL